MDRLIEMYRKKLRFTSTALIRSMVYEINRDARLIGIRGARGVYCNSISSEIFRKTNEPYMSLDSIYFSDNILMTLRIVSWNEEEHAYTWMRYINPPSKAKSWRIYTMICQNCKFSLPAPFIPNISKLCEWISITRNVLLTYLNVLAESKLTYSCFFFWYLSPLKANIGNMRETFFANQLKKSHQVTTLDLHPSITDKIERINL